MHHGVDVRPKRMVIAGAVVAHEELVELADKHFSP